jgi:hypothetical protein
MMAGSGKVWSPRSHAEAAGVHLFCLHAAKESGRAVDLFARTEGDTARSPSPTRGVSSSPLFLDGWLCNNPNPMYMRTFSRTCLPMRSRFANGGCNLPKLRSQMIFNCTFSQSVFVCLCGLGSSPPTHYSPTACSLLLHFLFISFQLLKS